MESMYKVGDLLVQYVGSQENFYKIVYITPSGKSVCVQHIGKRWSNNGQGISPNPSLEIGEPIMCRVVKGKNTDNIKIEGYCSRKITYDYVGNDFND